VSCHCKLLNHQCFKRLDGESSDDQQLSALNQLANHPGNKSQRKPGNSEYPCRVVWLQPPAKQSAVPPTRETAVNRRQLVSQQSPKINEYYTDVCRRCNESIKCHYPNVFDVLSLINRNWAKHVLSVKRISVRSPRVATGSNMGEAISASGG